MRDAAIDLCRGFAVLEMELASRSSKVAHAPVGADYMTYADTIFPMFAFLAGTHRPRISRSLSTIGLGIAYNFCREWPLRGAAPKKLRLFGVLQRLGLSSLLYAAGSPKSGVLPIVLTALWVSLTFGLCEDPGRPYKTPQNSAQTRIDRLLLPNGCRLYANSYDPEGLLGSLTTAISMWFGGWVDAYQPGFNEGFVTSLSLMSMGYMTSYAFPHAFPVSKPFWTLSFTLITSGLSLLKYTAAKIIVRRLPLRPVQLLGRHSLGAFIFSAVLHKIGFYHLVKRQFQNEIVADLAASTAGAIAMISMTLIL